ncbi:hypothetical protein GTZ96_010930, partial [Flavobacterium sp. BBQ-18]|nr:hypothetical protein [Flavobacterium undicola]
MENIFTKKEKLLHTIALIIVCVFSFIGTIDKAYAQAPQAIPYQGVARNASGDIRALQNISLRFTIHNSTSTGATVFQETHTVMTTNLGLFNVNIGSGTAVTGTLAAISWGTGTKFIQVEMMAPGDAAFVNMGTTQLNSVPYALYAENAATVSSALAAEITRATTAEGTLTTNLATEITNRSNADNLKANISGQVFTGAISATNLSGTNTGDQVLPTLASLGAAPLASPAFTGTVSGINKAMVGLGNVVNLDTSNPVNITEDATHRFTTDAEKSIWNGKQNALGYTAEDSANKSIDVTADGGSNTKYPSVKSVKTYVDSQDATKADKTYVDSQDATKADITYVDSQDATKADKTYVDSQDATKADKTYV